MRIGMESRQAGLVNNTRIASDPAEPVRAEMPMWALLIDLARERGLRLEPGDQVVPVFEHVMLDAMLCYLYGSALVVHRDDGLMLMTQEGLDEWYRGHEAEREAVVVRGAWDMPSWAALWAYRVAEVYERHVQALELAEMRALGFVLPQGNGHGAEAEVVRGKFREAWDNSWPKEECWEANPLLEVARLVRMR